MPPAGSPNKITPELEAFADRLVESIRVVSQQESLKLKDALRAEFISILDRRIDATEAKILALRTEMREDMIEVKGELREQSATLNDHSKEIATIKARLEEGDKWMKDHEVELKEVNEQGIESRITLAGIAAKLGETAVAGTVGGGVALAITKLLHG